MHNYIRYYYSDKAILFGSHETNGIHHQNKILHEYTLNSMARLCTIHTNKTSVKSGHRNKIHVYRGFVVISNGNFIYKRNTRKNSLISQELIRRV